MHTDDHKPSPDDSHELPSMTDNTFDVRDLGPMADDEADAEWLRHPEAWHLH
jgi:hypothetical protein